MKNKYVLCFGLMACVLLFSSISESYGHGLGYEIMPPEMLGSKLVSLEISSDTWPDEFKVIITTGDNYSNVLSPPLDYDVGISFLDKTSYSIDDINFGQQELSIITYYDLINDDFVYDQSKKIITYSMPFNWSEENILVTSTMHQEIIIPKPFGDLMVKDFSATVNGVQVSENVLTIDDYSPKNRLVHLVLNQNDILEISKKTDGFPNKMDFSIMPSADNLPLTTMTENAQFKLNLSWEPQNIKSDSTTTFFFEVLDAFLLDRQVSVGYDLSILHGGERVFQTNGISNDSVHSMIEFEIPDDVTGMITLQFENLNGSDLADASFHVVVDRVGIAQTSIPVWIKNNAGWWATDQIDDSSFLKGIQYLIQEGIMIIPPTEVSESAISQAVPAWIKNNAGWWATDQIDDSAFVQGIQYLIQEGIIVV